MQKISEITAAEPLNPRAKLGAVLPFDLVIPNLEDLAFKAWNPQGRRQPGRAALHRPLLIWPLTQAFLKAARLETTSFGLSVSTCEHDGEISAMAIWDQDQVPWLGSGKGEHL